MAELKLEPIIQSTYKKEKRSIVLKNTFLGKYKKKNYTFEHFHYIFSGFFDQFK